MAKGRKAKKSPLTTQREMIQKYGYFDIPVEHREIYITCLTKFYSEQALIKDENQAQKRAVEVYDLLVNGLSPEGKPWSMTSMDKFDSRVRSVTKGLWHGTKETEKNLIVYSLNRGEDNKSALLEDDIFKFVKDTEANDFQEEFEALIKQYPDLSRGDIKKDVQLYCAINLQLRRLSFGSGKEVDLKRLVDAKVSLGNFLGLSEKMRMEEIITQKKDNIASLSIQFEQTIREMPSIVEKFHKKELKMLLNKFDRGELPSWLFSHPSHAAMSVEEARRIVGENEDTIYS